MVEVFANPGGADAAWLDREAAGENDGWYRGDTINFFPNTRDVTKEELSSEIYTHVLKGWEPKEKLLTTNDLVTAFGSCFAHNIEKYLRKKGFTTSIGLYGSADIDNYWGRSLILKCGEGFVNTFSIRQQFEWIFDDKIPELSVWKKTRHVMQKYIDDNKEASSRIFYDTKFFVITLGLSEVWYNKKTQKVLWSGVPKSEFDSDIYGFRVSSVQENLENVRAIVDLVRNKRGNIPIVFTLSPVPLAATFRPVSCITASSVSKSILRVAIDELMRERPDDKFLHYFPSYELVMNYFRDPWDSDRLHPNQHTINTIMETFIQFYAAES